jgi:hypothetical protein
VYHEGVTDPVTREEIFCGKIVLKIEEIWWIMLVFLCGSVSFNKSIIQERSLFPLP